MDFHADCPLPANLKAEVERLVIPVQGVLQGLCSVCESVISDRSVLSDRTEEYRRVCKWSDTPKFARMIMTPAPYMIFCARLLEFTPKQFERLVSDLFRQMGADPIIGPVGANGAIDILLEFDDGDFIIQCKKWKAKVGVGTVREAYGAAVKHQVKGAFIVTTSEFTHDAKWFPIDLRPPSVALIDGKKLFDLMKQHMPSVVADIQEGIWRSQKATKD